MFLPGAERGPGPLSPLGSLRARSLQRKIKPHALGLDGFLKVRGPGVLFQNQNGKGDPEGPLCGGEPFPDRRAAWFCPAAVRDSVEPASTLLTVWASQRP